MARPKKDPRKRIREGIRRLSEDKQNEIARRVTDFYEQDVASRYQEREQRLQRYAKYRQWTEGKSFPWADSSDQAIPDMAESSLRTQDTLHNAVMSGRPSVVTSRALKKKDEDKVDVIDNLIDTQFFTEQPGEKVVEEMSEEFTNEPSCTVFVNWIRERRNTFDVRTFDSIPDSQTPPEYFRKIMLQSLQEGSWVRADDEGWEYLLTFKDKRTAKVRFYTTDDDKNEVEMVVEEESIVFNGPRAIVKSYEDVIVPPEVANLQIPGPSNPGGAPHVILRDYPTIDELKRLRADGTYNYMSKEDEDRLANIVKSRNEQAEKDQKDILEGKSNQSEQTPPDRTHNTLTRLLCFDVIEMGKKAEDRVHWVLLETKSLLRSVPLGELYPFHKPRRPLAESTYLPVKGRRSGISLLELIEGLHDWRKQMIDQAVDSGTLANSPFWFYRAGSSIKPDMIRLGPGDGMPLTDPQRDINFPKLPNQSQAFALNVIEVIQQMHERLSLLGDIQAGRVPQGKASALRTVGGIQTILAQGEARPERVLRRFFMMLTDVFRMYHELNVKMLPPNKEFRVSGFMNPDKNPYLKIENREQLEGAYLFDFNANVQNSSRESKFNALTQLAQFGVNPLMVQSGILNPDGLYRLTVDITRILGQDPDRYWKPPTPEAFRRSIMAEDALDTILDGQVPIGRPLEGAQMHLEKMMAFAELDVFGSLPEHVVVIYRQYLQATAQQARRDQEMAGQLQAAQQTAQQLGQLGAGGGNGAAGPTAGQIQAKPPVQGNELRDESLPGAGGGGNP